MFSCMYVSIFMPKIYFGGRGVKYCNKVPDVSKIPKLSYSLSLINGVRL